MRWCCLSRLSRRCQIYYIRSCKGLKGILGLFCCFCFSSVNAHCNLGLLCGFLSKYTHRFHYCQLVLKRKHLYLCARHHFPKLQILHSDLCNEIHYGPALTEWGFMKRLNPTLAFFPFWECHIPLLCVRRERGVSRASLRELWPANANTAKAKISKGFFPPVLTDCFHTFYISLFKFNVLYMYRNINIILH